MYITYTTRQWKQERVRYSSGRDRIKLIGPHDRPTRKMPQQLPKPAFTPTWLVRTSDMTVVPGSSVSKGYCALSYSWNQSGDMFVDESTGDTNRIDEGKHRIIFPARTVWKKPRGRKRISRKVKFVKFEGIIQQVCKDFGVEYIWYDQMCIPQDDSEAKHHEIHQMHQIYSSAFCTVVLLPDFETINYRPVLRGERPSRVAPSFLVRDSLEWLHRLWTLEEAVLSRKLLFVGRDVHFWWYTQHPDDYYPTALATLCRRPLHSDKSWWNACNTLYHAHSRITTKDHDRVFALAVLFPDIMNKITINYKQSPRDLMVQFYGFLAEKDLSILCFERQAGVGPLYKYNLPSWTGVVGMHMTGHTFNSSNNVAVQVDGEFLHVTCTGLASKQQAVIGGEDPSSWTFDDMPPEPEGPLCDYSYRPIGIYIPLPGGDKKTIRLHVDYFREDRTVAISPDIHLLSFFMPVRKENLFWLRDSEADSKRGTRFSFALTEYISHTAEKEGEYEILTGVQFDAHAPPGYINDKRFPVIKREGKYYKAIGTCLIENPKYLFGNYTELHEKTYIIK